jgi:hypothetical protein
VETYEKEKIAPFARYVGATFTGAVLRGEEGSEPDELALSFEGHPDIVVGVWHGMGASGFDIESEAANG